MSEATAYLVFQDRDDWRAWLTKNHQTASEVWLLHHKKRFQGPTISLEDAVEEALCFGWIDNALRRRDEKTYLHRYSPRNPDSVWSIHNIARVEKLIEAGLMTTWGLAKIQAAKENGQWEAAFRREDVEAIPPDLDTALRAQAGALEAYRALTPSRKKQLRYWLQSAKRAETKKRRIQAILGEVNRREPGAQQPSLENDPVLNPDEGNLE